MSLFSQRHSPPPDVYVYVVPEIVRRRIMHTLQQYRDPFTSASSYSFNRLLDEVGGEIQKQIGGLFQSPYEAAQVSDDPVINHFFLCRDEECLDFIQLCFEAHWMGGEHAATSLCESINIIFEEMGIGYGLIPPRTIDMGPASNDGLNRGRRISTISAKIYKKNERSIHNLVVEPALEALRDSRLATANRELLDAFQKMRHGNYADAITSCGAAYESVLKTICDEKQWAYDPEKDGCAKLIKACQDHNLLYSFYSPILEGVGTMRNKLGDAHGKGPKPAYEANRSHAEHMIAVTSANIVLLLQQAGF